MPGVNVTCPEATYLLWLDLRSTGIEGKPSEFFLREGKVAMNEGAWFGEGGEGFVRLNFGTPRVILEQGLKQLKAALEGVPAASS